jgi:hypothetical protein
MEQFLNRPCSFPPPPPNSQKTFVHYHPLISLSVQLIKQSRITDKLTLKHSRFLGTTFYGTKSLDMLSSKEYDQWALHQAR